MSSSRLNLTVNVVGIAMNSILILFTILGISFPDFPINIPAKNLFSLVSGISLFYFNVFILVFIFNKYENKISELSHSIEERDPGRELVACFFIAAIVWVPQFLLWRLWYKGELQFWSTFFCALLGVVVVMISAAAIGEYFYPYSEKIKSKEAEKTKSKGVKK